MPTAYYFDSPDVADAWARRHVMLMEELHGEGLNRAD